MPVRSQCLDTSDGVAYFADELSAGDAAALEAHVESCGRCQRLLARLSREEAAGVIFRQPTAPESLPPQLVALLERTRPAGPAAADVPHGRTEDSGEVVVHVEPAVPHVPGFERREELGRGGMGVVYLASDAGGRDVALKVILACRGAGRETLDRFREEASLLARIRHPNVVRVLEVGESDGIPYLAMEYLPGGSLRRWMARGDRSPVRCAELVAQLAGAVQALHTAGVVHRDLKPENVLLAADGTLRVADFGLACRFGSGDVVEPVEALTGSPRYMAPEQAAGRAGAVGPAADIYALGAILYELLTGVPPFQAVTLSQMLARILSEEPRAPRRLVPGIPNALETVALCCLEKDPARRYASAAHLAADLGRFLAGRPILARRVGLFERFWRQCLRRPLLIPLVASAGTLAALPVSAFARAATVCVVTTPTTPPTSLSSVSGWLDIAGRADFAESVQPNGLEKLIQIDTSGVSGNLCPGRLVGRKADGGDSPYRSGRMRSGGPSEIRPGWEWRTSRSRSRLIGSRRFVRQRESSPGGMVSRAPTSEVNSS
jgi:serine/threonine protein kinase